MFVAQDRRDSPPITKKKKMILFIFCSMINLIVNKTFYLQIQEYSLEVKGGLLKNF